jgi:hypothetical protein
MVIPKFSGPEPDPIDAGFVDAAKTGFARALPAFCGRANPAAATP